jgi:hypothetical protein
MFNANLSRDERRNRAGSSRIYGEAEANLPYVDRVQSVRKKELL